MEFSRGLGEDHVRLWTGGIVSFDGDIEPDVGCCLLRSCWGDDIIDNASARI